METNPITDVEIDRLIDELHRLNPSHGRLVLDDCRRAAIKDYRDIQACPGSGKTTLVAFKLLLLAKNWRERHSGMCVLTHTNVAKHEILKCLRRHPSGHKLLSYPHFIGTIQEFVNTFLALPYARARGWNVNVVDGETYDRLVTKRNWGKAKDRTTGKSYLFTSYFRSKKIQPVDFALTHELGRLVISTDFLSAVNKHIDPTDVRFSSASLLKKRERLCESGIFQYREMYALAEQALCDNGQLSETLRHRFPIVILDEMQDAQKFQDELINHIFKIAGCRVQRFGDPDQSIYDHIGDAEPNTSYNDSALVPICESHRFSPDIARKINGLSYRKLSNLTTSCPTMPGHPPNSILLYDDTSICKVIDRFADLAAQLPPRDRQVVKAVGAIAKEPSEGDLTIKSYWPAFQKSQAATTYKPASVFDAVRHCAHLETGEVAIRCDVIVQSIVNFLRIAEPSTVHASGTTAFHTKATLTRQLRTQGREGEFRQLLAELVMNPLPSAVQWRRVVGRLMAILGFDDGPNDAAREYLSYGTAESPTAARPASPANVYCSASGVQVHLSTIHAVKGETHDATLVLETKFNKVFDISALVDCLIRDDVPRTSLKVLKARSMKRLYVAASRPRHLLCLATHRDRMSADQRTLLQNERGWNLIEV